MSNRQAPSAKSFSVPPPTSNSTQASQSHAPLQPSGLREAHTLVASPDEVENDDTTKALESQESSVHPSPNTRATQSNEESGDESLIGRLNLGDLPSRATNETTALLRKPIELIKPYAHDGSSDHGTFSPRVESRPQSVRSGTSSYGIGYPFRGHAREGSGDSAAVGGTRPERPLLGRLFTKSSPLGSTRSHKKKMSTTSYLAEVHGITNTTTM